MSLSQAFASQPNAKAGHVVRVHDGSAEHAGLPARRNSSRLGQSIAMTCWTLQRRCSTSMLFKFVQSTSFSHTNKYRFMWSTLSQLWHFFHRWNVCDLMMTAYKTPSMNLCLIEHVVLWLASRPTTSCCVNNFFRSTKWLSVKPGEHHIKACCYSWTERLRIIQGMVVFLGGVLDSLGSHS